MESSVPDPMDKEKRMAGIDVVTAVIVMAVGIAVSIVSVGMPRPGGWDSAPGLIPLLFAASMFVMGLGLFISALRRKGPAVLMRMATGLSGGSFTGDGRVRRTLWIILLTGAYTLLLTGRLRFEIASAVFLAATLGIFWRRGGWLKIILISGLIPLLFGFVIRVLFSNLLPGDSIFDLFL